MLYQDIKAYIKAYVNSCDVSETIRYKPHGDF